MRLSSAHRPQEQCRICCVRSAVYSPGAADRLKWEGMIVSLWFHPT